MIAYGIGVFPLIIIPYLGEARVFIPDISDEREDPYAICYHG